MRAYTLLSLLITFATSAQYDTLFAYVNTGQCASHSAGLAALRSVPPELSVQINFSRNDSSIHQAVLKRLVGDPIPRNISIGFRSEQEMRKSYAAYGASSYSYVSLDRSTHHGALDDLPANLDLIINAWESLRAQPDSISISIPLSASTHSWSNNRYTALYDEFLVGLYLVDRKPHSKNDPTPSTELTSTLLAQLGGLINDTWFETERASIPGTLIIKNLLDLHFTDAESSSFNCVVQIRKDSTSKDIFVEYADGFFRIPRKMPSLPASYAGYTQVAPESSSLTDMGLYSSFSPMDESEPWDKRFFLRFILTKESVDLDESYDGCVYPKALEARGFGSFLAAGSMAGPYFICGIVPALINMSTCQETDFTEVLSLASRDIGMHPEAYYTQCLHVVNEHLNLVYSWKGKLHLARFETLTMRLIDNRPLDINGVNWSSLSMDDTGRVVALNDERTALIVTSQSRSTP